MEGTIPITHIRLIYDDSSDDEGKPYSNPMYFYNVVELVSDALDRYAEPIPTDNRLYDGEHFVVQ